MLIIENFYIMMNGLICYYWVLSLKFHPQMVIEIHHLQKPIISSMVQKMHFQMAQTIQLVIKPACAQSEKEVRACVLAKNTGKVHMH
jgi:hypothetical protein